jgi:hypothetical protein
MPIVNLNGVSRKNARPIEGDVFGQGLASQQHGTTVATGRTYNSPFTHSSRDLFPKGRSVAQMPALPALQQERAGEVVKTSDFVKVQPHEKGTFFSTKARVGHVQRRAGGPDIQHDTAHSPNQFKHTQARPVRKPLSEPGRDIHPSFMRGGGTLSANANHDKWQSRWSQTKKGVVE